MSYDAKQEANRRVGDEVVKRLPAPLRVPAKAGQAYIGFSLWFKHTTLTCLQERWTVIFTILHILQGLQLGSLGFEPEFGWATDVQDFFDDIIAPFRLGFKANAYIGIFLAFSITVLSFVFLTMCFAFGGIDVSGVGMLQEYFWFWFGDAVLFGVLLIPFSRSMFEMFHCENGHLVNADFVECWEGIHTLYVVLAVVTLLVMAFASIIKAHWADHTAHDPACPTRVRSSVLFFDSKYQCYRLVAVLLSVFLATESTTCAAVLFVLSLIPLAFILYYQPFLHGPQNHVMAGVSACVTFTFCLTLATSSAGPSDDLLLLFVALPLVFAVFAGASWYCGKLRPPTEADYSTSPGLQLKEASAASAFAKKKAIDEEKALHIENITDTQLKEWLSNTVLPRSEASVTALHITRSPNTNAAVSTASIESIGLIAKCIQSQRSLFYFTLNGHKLDSQRIDILLPVFSEHPNLREINVFNCGISPADGVRVVKGVLAAEQVSKLTLAENNLNAAARVQIGDLVKQSRKQGRATRLRVVD